MEIDHKIVIIKQLSGNASEDEIAMLDRWRQQDAANENTYKEIEKLWITVGKGKGEFMPNVDDAWTKLNQKRNTKKSVWPAVLKIAASLIICIGLGFFAKQYFFKNNEHKLRAQHKKHNATTVTVNDVLIETTDSVQEVLFPDSSIAMLNANSSLKYSKLFDGTQRLVDLTGEAFFEVIPFDRDFIVSTEYLNVKVIGTSFNVRSFENDSIDEIIVNEGTVEVTSKKDETKNVVLNKGEKGIYDRKNDSFTTEKLKSRHKWWNRFSQRFKKLLEKIRHKKADK